MHKTLEFSNLPLLRVECVFKYQEDITVSLDTLWAIREAVKSQLPEVTDFNKGGISSGMPFSFSIGPGAGATFVSEDGLSLDIRRNSLSAAWSREDKAYPRFNSLKAILELASKMISHVPQIASMSYVNLAPLEHGTAEELLTQAIFPEALRNGILSHDVNLSYRLSSGVDFRIQYAKTKDGTLITTNAGTRIQNISALNSLDIVHDTLTDQFSQLITDYAKEKWELQK